MNVSDNKHSIQLKRLNHIALVVPDLPRAVAFYQHVLKAKVSKPLPLPDHGVTTVFVDLNNTKLELLYPLGNDSPIAKFLEKNPTGGIHHFCIEVEDVHQAYHYLSQQHIRILAPPRPGAHGENVIFLHPKDCFGSLIELEEVNMFKESLTNAS